MKYSFREYLKKKQSTSVKESSFLKNIISFFGSVVDCYVEMCQQLKVEIERKKTHEEQLLGHVEDMLNGVESIKELKDMKNSEVGLFGISKKTEKEYITALNRARQNLFAVFYLLFNKLISALKNILAKWIKC